VAKARRALVRARSDRDVGGDENVSLKNQEHRAEFEGRFSRCRNSLYFLAWGALGSVGEAEEVMENCYRKACRQPQRSTSDGELGSWMIRLLINEIVLVANQRRVESSEMSEAEYPEAR
jgi:DNA-directed RNA polymerase specialized sigma24 family protein